MTPRIIDVNVNLSRWPTRRLPDDETPKLVARLRRNGVAEAWAGSLDGLLHRDVAGVNARLAQECRSADGVRLVPFGSINPKLPDWQDDLRRCQEDHRMPGVRLHPNYHGYTLEDPVFAELLALTAKRGMVVGLCLTMEDVRMMHPMFRVPIVDAAPLAELVAKTPGLRMILLNSMTVFRGPALQKVVQAGEVYVDVSMQEGAAGVAGMLKDLPLDRVLFGSFAPTLYLESAILKLQESGLDPAQRAALLERNARRLLPASA